MIREKNNIILSLICIIGLTLGTQAINHLDNNDESNINGSWCAVKFIMQSSGGMFSVKKAKKLIGKKIIINNDIVKGFNSVCAKPSFKIKETSVDYLKDSLSLFDSFADQKILKQLPQKLTHVEIITKLHTHDQDGFDLYIKSEKNKNDTLIWNYEGTWFYFIKCVEPSSVAKKQNHRPHIPSK